MNPARLVVPVIRWDQQRGFAASEREVARTLAAGVGGYIIFGGPSEEVAGLTKRLQAAATQPLLIGADLERGAGQQFAGLRELPPPQALASLGDLGVIRDAGTITGLDAREVGVNWVFAPVADLDLEPSNPIVQTRSFGADPQRVSEAVAAWIEGANAAGVLSCAKHFPGHGRTTRDSHDHLPIVTAPLAELMATDLLPFEAAVRAGVDSVMTSHVAFPALDPTGLPATRSSAILQRLRGEGRFAGLIVSDALIMAGVRGGDSVATACVSAVAAGVDVLLYPPDPIAIIEAIAARVKSDRGFGGVVAAAIERCDRAAATAAARLSRSPPVANPTDVADRIVAQLETSVALRAPVELVVVDDDLDGAYPASSSDFVRLALAARGVPLGSGGSRVALVFAEPRASKGRANLGLRSLQLLAETQADLVVLFAHPRLRAQLTPGTPVIEAWHRQRLMQESVARWIGGRVGAPGERNN